MAGRPKTRSFLAELERRAKRDSTPDAPMETALDWVVDYVASGGRIMHLASELDVTAGTLRRGLRLKFGDEGYARVEAARLDGGHALAEQAIARAERIDGKEDAAGARIEVGALQWTAERWNRQQLGAQPKVAVGVQVGLPQQHLDALRQLARRDRQQKVLKAEVIEVNGDAGAPELAAGTRAFLEAPPSAPPSDNRADTQITDAA